MRLALAVLLVACKAEPEPTCEDVMAHLSPILTQFGATQQDVAACKQRKLTADQKRCLLRTKDLTDVASCKAGQIQPDIRIGPP